MFIEVIGAFLVCISFGVLFNIKGKRLLLAGVLALGIIFVSTIFRNISINKIGKRKIT